MKITERINKFSPANFIKINTNKKEIFSSVAFLFIMYALAISPLRQLVVCLIMALTGFDTIKYEKNQIVVILK